MPALCELARQARGNFSVQRVSLLLLASLPSGALAQSNATLSGLVLDPSGARVAHASVTIVNEANPQDSAAVESDRTGSFTAALPPGTYVLTITAPGFSPNVVQGVTLSDAPHAPLSIRLAIAAKAEVIDVAPQNDASTSAADNKSAMVFGQEKLDMLSDDDATMQQQLTALAGGDPSHPADIYIDGFSGGRFPPKSQIREVRINQNPFSAEYPSYGSNRMEIFTKPGGDTYHGNFFAIGNDAPFNANNPYTTVEPPYYSYYLDGFVSGPLFDKKTSFFAGSTYHKMQNNSVVDAVDPASFGPLSEAISTPDNTQTYTARIDRQISTNNTFTARYEYRRETLTNGGIGLLVLPSEAYNSVNLSQTLQLGDTQILTPKIISESRFQYFRTRVQQQAENSAPTVIVQGSFNGGGSNIGTQHNNQDLYEFQEYLSFEEGKHFIRAGARYDLTREANHSTANYNGTYTFPDLLSYKLTLQGDTPAQIQAADPGVTTQFSLTAGQSNFVLTSGTLGAYADDEWKLSKSVTGNVGLRFESQSAIPDHADWAPRIGLAWAVGQRDKKSPLVVLRAGFGIFYDRFAVSDIFTTVRQNGASQQTVTVNNPGFYLPAQSPSVASLEIGANAAPPIPYRIDPRLRTSYDEDATVTAERSLGKKGSVTATYWWARGPHQYLSQNINAPLPGTYNPADPASGVRPLGGTQNIFEFTSNGFAKGRLLLVYSNYQPIKRLSLFSFYVLQHERDDILGSTSFASNSYNVPADFGRSARVPHQRLYLGGSLNLPRKIAFRTFVAGTSGIPFNITTGSDLNGDTIFNDRPAFATDLTRPSVVKTRFGNFDTQPMLSQKIIPINYGNSPNLLIAQFNLDKTTAFGPQHMQPAADGKPAARSDKPYALRFGISAQNAFNSVNPSPPIGVLSSPLFGKSISLNSQFTPLGAANRVVDLTCNFSF